MSNTTKYQINVSLQDNSVTVNDKDDKIFVVVSQGTADQDRLVDEIMDVNPGLEPETIRMVLDLFNRIVMKLLLQGLRVNTGLINIAPSKEFRAILDNTTIHINGEAQSPMSVAGGESAQGAGFRVKAGRAFTLHGRNLKVMGDDPSVGISLTDSDGTVTKIEGDLIIQNDPKKLVFIIPAGLDEGDYELKVVTQYAGGNWKLKTPRTISRTLTIGEPIGDEPVTGGDDEEEDGPQVQ